MVEYDGSAYMGFQLQPNQPTVQGAIETALHRFTGESLRIRGASRTDSGAHAQGQVVDFLTESPHPAATFLRALNFYLPPDIRIQSAHVMTPDFHSRRSASSRVYRYQIL
ncbi:MAG: tRNA pseudouridine(38-40) synthase TruA, partial [Dehalococcoidia bacterium]